MGEGDLSRDLGLYSAVTLSMGAMIGGGIFVLPAIGYKKAGPAIIVAYLLAGLIVLPNALSKAEMATAMPEDGGTYIYIDRAMGPLFGTIAGIGVWFSLVFKSAFALVGLGAYLLLLVSIPATLVKVVALVLGATVILLNIVGTEKSGQVQGILVTLVVLVLGAYIVGGVGTAESVQYAPFVTHGIGGIATATAFVFVSYAGIGEVASVAEEITEPGRNIPRAMLISIGVMMVIYTAVVGVIVGIVPAETLIHGGPDGGTSLTPMADSAERVFGGVGVTVIAVTAVLALTSMANAGVLGTSRFLLAMSRDSLLPEQVGQINSRFLTPVNAVLVTGAVLLALIAFVPVVNLAKLASAFLILVFSLENLSVIIFREAEIDFYDPDFRSPGYPVVQILGMIGGVILIIQMGLLSIMGAIGISIGSAVWYFAYARSHTDRTGVLATYFDGDSDLSEPPDEATINSKPEED
ncbi:APC family permease [Halorubrum sp. N11]|uniref:APC family permease n=1 Tax=Halorubrum sp. N11 TaxID=3402276 RepID=UPI003EB83B34